MTASGRAEAFNGVAKNKGKPVEGCTFCEIVVNELPAFKVGEGRSALQPLRADMENHLQVYEDEYVIAFLGRRY